MVLRKIWFTTMDPMGSIIVNMTVHIILILANNAVLKNMHGLILVPMASEIKLSLQFQWS